MEPPRPPDDVEMKNIIDKLAQFVARFVFVLVIDRDIYFPFPPPPGGIWNTSSY